MSRIETGPAVHNGVLRYVSVSQLQTADPHVHGGCYRKWWFDKVAGHKQPETRSQKIGKQVHAAIEHYLLHGDDVLNGMAKQAERFIAPLAPRREELLIEHPIFTEEALKLCDELRVKQDTVGVGKSGDVECNEFELEVWHQKVYVPGTEHVLFAAPNVPVVGYIDVVNGSGYWVDNDGAEHEDTTDVEVIDWKTTSSIADYAKSAEGLASSIQMIGYAAWASRLEPSLETFRLSHGNIQTRGSGSEKRSTTVHLDVVQDKWQSVESTVRVMQQLAREPKVEGIEPNLKSCTAYGGCAYLDMCPRTAAQAMSAMFGGVSPVPAPAPAKKEGVKTVGFLSKHVTKKTDESAKPAAEPESKPATPGTESKPAEAKPATAVEATKPGDACKWCRASLTPDNSFKSPVSGERLHAGCEKRPKPAAAGVTPPDQPLSSPTKKAEVVPESEMAKLPPEVQDKAREHAAAVAASKPASAPVQEAKDDEEGEPEHGEGVTATGDHDKHHEAHTAGADEAPPVTNATGRKCSKCKKTGHTARTCTDKPAEAGAPELDAPAQEALKEATDKAQAAMEQVEAMEQALGAVVMAPSSEPSSDVSEMAGPATGIELYVDCMVEGVGFVESLDTYIAEKNKSLATMAGLPEGCRDIRFAGKDHQALGFGKWKGALAASVESDLPPPGRYSLMFVGEDELKQVVVATLKPHCKVFVRGVR